METKKTYPYSTRYTALALAKSSLLIFAAVYLWSPAVMFFKFGISDALFPFEVAACCVVSVVLGYWSFKTVWDLIK